MKPTVRTGPKRLRHKPRDQANQHSRWMSRAGCDKHETQRMRDRADRMAARRDPSFGDKLA